MKWIPAGMVLVGLHFWVMGYGFWVFLSSLIPHHYSVYSELCTVYCELRTDF